jgi:hypothetical protein
MHHSYPNSTDAVFFLNQAIISPVQAAESKRHDASSCAAGGKRNSLPGMRQAFVFALGWKEVDNDAGAR